MQKGRRRVAVSLYCTCLNLVVQRYCTWTQTA